MKIGSISINSHPPLALSPMAGYTNIALRELIAQMGADIVYSELASSSALARQYEGKTNQKEKQTKQNASQKKHPNSNSDPTNDALSKTDSLIQTSKFGISAIQIFGSNPKEISNAIKYIDGKIQTGENFAKFIDLNFGCPAPKVLKSGAGSALLLSPKKISEIANAAAKSSSIPISAKLRILPKLDESIQIAKLLEKNGISMLAVHGRTQKQRFSGASSWESIGKIRENVSIPIIGNGDVKSPQDAKKIMEVSGCDGAMIGRAALSNPFIFLQARQYFENGKFEQFGWNEKTKFLQKYLLLCKKYEINFIYPKELAIKQASEFRGAGKLRLQISKCKTEEELNEFIASGQD